MKAILVIDIDDKFEGCTILADCKLHKIYDSNGNYYVDKNESFIGEVSNIYLKPMPSKYKLTTEKGNRYAVGYNDCIDDILGGEDDR